jgi:hypothetical protein
MTDYLSKSKAIMACLVLAMPIYGIAAPQWCGGTIGAVWVDHTGDLFTLPSWRGDHLRVCSVKQTLTVAGRSIDQTTCLSWMAMLRQAKQAGAAVLMHYDDVPSCAQVPTYNAAPLPFYVMLN